MTNLNQGSIREEAGRYRLSLGRIGRRLALLLTFCAILIFQGAWPSLAKRAHLIRVGIFQNRPIVFQDEHGVPQGLYVDLLRKIAEEEDWEIEFVPGSWGQGLKRLRTGEIDLMTSIAYTKERDKHMDFSSENVLMMWGQVYVKPDSDIQNILDLKGQKVAILKDGINGINFRKLSIGFDVNCQFVVADTYKKVFDLVAGGKVDAGVANNIHGDILTREYGVQRSPILFNPFSLLFAVPDGKHRELLSAIDNRLADLKRDQNSFYYETLDHWFGGDAARKFRTPRWVIHAFVIIGGLLLFFLIWIYVLNAQVKRRTREATLTAKVAHENEQYNRMLFENSPIGLALCRMDGTLVDVNSAYVNIIGRNVEETLKLTYWDITPEKYAELEAAQLESLENTERYRPYEKEYIHKDGHLIPVRLSGMILEKDGEPFILSSVENITERKKIEEAITWESSVNAAMTDLSRALITLVSIEDMSVLVLENAKRLTDSKFGYVGYIDPDTASLVCPTLTRDIWDKCRVPDKNIVFEKFSGLFGWVLENREPLLTNTPADDPRSSGTPQGHIPIHRFLSVPALIGETLGGQLAVANADRNYTERDLEVLERLADLYAMSIERERAEDALRKAYDELEQRVQKRTTELQTIVNAMAGREVRMVELKETIRKLHTQIESAGLTPVADDPLLEISDQ
jgi:PAS domain S-box-containing protein